MFNPYLNSDWPYLIDETVTDYIQWEPHKYLHVYKSVAWGAMNHLDEQLHWDAGASVSVSVASGIYETMRNRFQPCSWLQVLLITGMSKDQCLEAAECAWSAWMAFIAENNANDKFLDNDTSVGWFDE